MAPDCVEELRPVEGYVAVTPIRRIEMTIVKVGLCPDCVSARVDPELVGQERSSTVPFRIIPKIALPAASICCSAAEESDLRLDAAARPGILRGRAPADEQRYGLGQR
jgi:hypothetical protein